MQGNLVPIVAKADAEPFLAAGQKLLAELKPLARKAYEKTGEYKLLRMEICRRACALSLDPHAKAQAAKHYEVRSAGKGFLCGRPSSVHSLFFDDLAKATGISRETIKRWLVEWNQFAAALGIPLDEQEGVRVGKTPLQALYESSITTRDRSTPETSGATCTRSTPTSVTEWIEHVLGQYAPVEEPEKPVSDEVLASKIEQALARFTKTVAEVHAMASSKKINLKKFRNTEAVERALDRVNAEAELLGFAWVTINK